MSKSEGSLLYLLVLIGPSFSCTPLFQPLSFNPGYYNYPRRGFFQENYPYHQGLFQDGFLYRKLSDENLPFRKLPEETLEAPETVARETNLTCNHGKGEIIIIGEMYPSRPIRPIIKVCFNRKDHMTFWTKHVVKKTGPCRNQKRGWANGFNTDLNMGKIYNEVADVVEGQLAPQCDFRDPKKQQATFFYINAAPQMKAFHDGSWKEMEDYIREKVNRKGISSALVFTGTVGSQYLIDGAVNFPVYFYKVVNFDNGDLEVYVGVNDITKEHEVICKDVVKDCGSPDVKRGKMYCCRMDKELVDVLGLQGNEIS